jgi:hypothetical protein
MNEVPFGRYKGRPVEEMLADGAYMAWLEAQPWFRERFGHLRTAKEQDAMSRTPVHNRLQVLFLDLDYLGAFCKATHADWLADCHERMLARISFEIGKAKVAAQEAQNHADELARAMKGEIKRPGPFLYSESMESQQDAALRRAVDWAEAAKKHTNTIAECAYRVAFESKGADVCFFAEPQYLALTDDHFTAFHSKNFSWSRPPKFETITYTQKEFAIEIKPTVADEYPAVLRQMNRNKSTYLFVESYEGEGATEAQFVAMFAASGKQVVFKRDVDALL